MNNGIEILPNWVEDIALQAIKKGFGQSYNSYKYIEIPLWGVLRFDCHNNVIYCDGYVPWSGF